MSPMPETIRRYWPTHDIRIATPRLSLRLPSINELGELAELAYAGVHRPGERPFLSPWTEVEPAERARTVLAGHWHNMSSWETGNWRLGLAVIEGDKPVGMVTLRAADFAIRREVATSSWLGLDHHGRGLGTEARIGLLTLAFDHLGADDAVTEVFQDNYSSQGFSRKLGYEFDGISRDVRDSALVVSDRLRLTAAKWQSVGHPRAEVDGLERARSMFGV